jgi:hypothetical protein
MCLEHKVIKAHFANDRYGALSATTMNCLPSPKAMGALGIATRDDGRSDFDPVAIGVAPWSNRRPVEDSEACREERQCDERRDGNIHFTSRCRGRGFVLVSSALFVATINFAVPPHKNGADGPSVNEVQEAYDREAVGAGAFTIKI